jgi:hypothetical protein
VWVYDGGCDGECPDAWYPDVWTPDVWVYDGGCDGECPDTWTPDSGCEGGECGCNEFTCPDGCCDPFTGQCLPGNNPVACGIGGETCEACDPPGICENGVCTTSGCSEMTCTEGCCLGTVCLAGTSNFACGSEGMECVDCVAFHETCETTVFPHACE